jgi:uncharacterized protein with PIN domain
MFAQAISQAEVCRISAATFAQVSGEPLLFKGQDFRKTGIPAAL